MMRKVYLVFLYDISIGETRLQQPRPAPMLAGPISSSCAGTYRTAALDWFRVNA